MSKIYDALRKNLDERRGEGNEPPPPPPPAPPAGQGAKGPQGGQPSMVVLPALEEFPKGFWKSVNRVAAAIQGGVDENERSVMFVGAETGAGTSTLALATCLLLVRDPGVEVVLVDAHARPHTHPLLPTAQNGLIQLALGEVNMWEAVLRSNHRGLSYLPRGSGSYNGPKLFEKMIPLMSNLRAVFDFLILDVAPVITAPESAQLAGLCDGVVVVLTSERTPKGEAVRTKDILDQHHARILGTVINRTRRPGPLGR